MSWDQIANAVAGIDGEPDLRLLGGGSLLP